MTVSWEDFEKLDLRIGTIVEADDFPEARKPAYKLSLDFGPEIGLKKSSAQITDLYSRKELVGTQIVAVINFTPKQIGPFKSECLVLGAYNQNNEVVLLRTDVAVPNGAKIG